MVSGVLIVGGLIGLVIVPTSGTNPTELVCTDWLDLPWRVNYNEAFWSSVCSDIPENTVALRMHCVFGIGTLDPQYLRFSVQDGHSWCSMLTAGLNEQHHEVFDGASWVEPVYSSDPNRLGGDSIPGTPTTPLVAWGSLAASQRGCFQTHRLWEGTLRAATCAPCPAGSENVGGACQPCAVGSFSLAGGACTPVIARAVGLLPEPILTITRDDRPAGSEQITLTLQLEPLPSTSEIWEARSLYYVVDVAPSEVELIDEAELGTSADNCRPRWTVTSGQAALVVDYTDLSLECALRATNDGALITRRGFVGVYVVSNHVDGTPPLYEMIERRWAVDVTLTFNATSTAHISAHVSGDIELDAQQFLLGGFVSELAIFQTDDFVTEKLSRDFEVGDAVHAEHALRNRSAELDLRIIRVWLSTSVDPEDAARHDLTSQVLVHESGRSEAHFTIIARRCERCYLHCLSQVSNLNSTGLLTGSRRLDDVDSAPVYSVQTLYVEMSPPTGETALSHAVGAEGGTPQSLGLLEVAVIAMAGVCLLGMITSAWLLCRLVRGRKAADSNPKASVSGPRNPVTGLANATQDELDMGAADAKLRQAEEAPQESELEGACQI